MTFVLDFQCTSLSRPSVTSSLALSLTEDSLQTEVAKGLFAVTFCCLGFVFIRGRQEYFACFVSMNQVARPPRTSSLQCYLG